METKVICNDSAVEITLRTLHNYQGNRVDEGITEHYLGEMPAEHANRLYLFIGSFFPGVDFDLYYGEYKLTPELLDDGPWWTVR